jgi:hypothetical protein
VRKRVAERGEVEERGGVRVKRMAERGDRAKRMKRVFDSFYERGKDRERQRRRREIEQRGEAERERSIAVLIERGDGFYGEGVKERRETVNYCP